MEQDERDRLLAECTPKQRAWLKAYQGEARGNACQAARLAGYKNDRYGDTVRKKLRKMGLLTPLSTSAPEIADPAEIQAFLTSVVRGEVQDEAPDETGDLAPAGVKLADRVKAAIQLGRMQGLYVERVEHTNTGRIVVLEMPDNGRLPSGDT